MARTASTIQGRANKLIEKLEMLFAEQSEYTEVRAELEALPAPEVDENGNVVSDKFAKMRARSLSLLTRIEDSRAEFIQTIFTARENYDLESHERALSVCYNFVSEKMVSDADANHVARFNKILA